MANPLSLKDIADFKIPANNLVDDSDTTFSYYSSGSVPLYDRSYIDLIRANRLMFFPASYVLIERSTDNGATWTTVPTSGTDSVNNDRRAELTAEITSNSIAMGKAGTQTTSMQLRVTFKYPGNNTFYCGIDRAYMYFTNSGHNCEVKMDASTYGAQSTYTDIFGWRGISGWSGPNLYKFPYRSAWGSNSSAHLYNIRFTFRYLSINSSYATSPAYIKNINLYGANQWGSTGEPRNLAHLYKWDKDKNVTFPTKVYSGAYKLTAEKELTQAQYDALSNTEKMNGTAYFITDAGHSVVPKTPILVADLRMSLRSVSGNQWHNIGFVNSEAYYNAEYVTAGGSDGASGTALKIIKPGKYMFCPNARHTDFSNATTDCAWAVTGAAQYIEHWHYDKNRGGFYDPSIVRCVVNNQCFFGVYREGATMDWTNTDFAKMEVFYLGE